MANNPKAKDNLRILKKGETANPNGRPKKLINLISEIPKEEQLKIYNQLLNVIRCRSIAEAKELLKDQTTGEYGVVYELAIEALLSSNGWSAMNDILDRLFGKPKLVSDNVVKQESPGLLISFGDTGLNSKK